MFLAFFFCLGCLFPIGLKGEVLLAAPEYSAKPDARSCILMDGKTGKQAVLVLRCASQLGLITMPTYQQALGEFPGIGAKSGYYRYLEFPFNESETAPVSKAIRKMMEEE